MKRRIVPGWVVAAAATLALALTMSQAPVARADAPAPKSLHVAQEDGKLVVRAQTVQATGDPPRGIGNRIEIDVIGAAIEVGRLAVDDAAVKRIDLTAGDEPKLTLILHHDVKAADLAALMRIDNDENGLRITLPHAPIAPIGPAAPAAPIGAPIAGAPHASADLDNDARMHSASAAIVQKRGPAAAIAHEPAEAAPAPIDEAKAAAPGSESAEADPARAIGIADAHPQEAPGAETSTAALVGIIAILLVAGSLIAWSRRRRRGGAPAFGDAIHIVATRSLGAKLRLVLLSVGDQRVLLSVSDAAAQPIGSWRQRQGEDGDHDPRIGRSFAASLQDLDEEGAIPPSILAAAGIAPKTRNAIPPTTIPAPIPAAPIAPIAAPTPPSTDTATGIITLPWTAAPIAAPILASPPSSIAAPIPAASIPTDATVVSISAAAHAALAADKTAAAASTPTTPPRRVSATAPTIAITHMGPMGPVAPLTQPAPAALSPAIAGLLKLRGQTLSNAAAAPAIAPTDDQPASTEADAAWARELLAATRMGAGGTPSNSNNNGTTRTSGRNHGASL